jgi:hypothetical protein
LETAYGAKVSGGIVHIAAGAPQALDLCQTRYILKRIVRNFERFIAAETRMTRPVPCCALVLSATTSLGVKKRASRRQPPFFVAGLSGAQVAKLEQAGIST